MRRQFMSNILPLTMTTLHGLLRNGVVGQEFACRLTNGLHMLRIGKKSAFSISSTENLAEIGGLRNPWKLVWPEAPVVHTVRLNCHPLSRRRFSQLVQFVLEKFNEQLTEF